MMLMWLWIGIIAIAIIGGMILVRQRRAPLREPRQPLPPSLKRTVFTLQLGDIVQYDGCDWVVEGRLTFNDSGYTWLEYMLQDGDTVRWLSVEEDDLVEVCWMETASNLDISGKPPQQLTHNGVTYRQVESGTAKMQRIGTTMNKQAQICRYVDYAADNDQLLSVEDWNGDVEVSVGRQIRPSALTLLPGDGHRVYDD